MNLDLITLQPTVCLLLFHYNFLITILSTLYFVLKLVNRVQDDRCKEGDQYSLRQIAKKNCLLFSNTSPNSLFPQSHHFLKNLLYYLFFTGHAHLKNVVSLPGYMSAHVTIIHCLLQRFPNLKIVKNLSLVVLHCTFTMY